MFDKQAKTIPFTRTKFFDGAFLLLGAFSESAFFESAFSESAFLESAFLESAFSETYLIYWEQKLPISRTMLVTIILWRLPNQYSKKGYVSEKALSKKALSKKALSKKALSLKTPSNRKAPSKFFFL